LSPNVVSAQYSQAVLASPLTPFSPLPASLNGLHSGAFSNAVLRNFRVFAGSSQYCGVAGPRRRALAPRVFTSLAHTYDPLPPPRAVSPTRLSVSPLAAGPHPASPTWIFTGTRLKRHSIVVMASLQTSIFLPLFHPTKVRI